MSEEELESFRKPIKEYFSRLSVLISQIPAELRPLLLPLYMTYVHVKGTIWIDSEDKACFEIARERSSRFSIKVMKIKESIEEKTFCVNKKKSNLFKVGGNNLQFQGLNFANAKFQERFKNQIPQNSTVFVAADPEMGVLDVPREGDTKLISCSIYWLTDDNKKYVKHISFAWVFGNKNAILSLNSQISAESDFYQSLFSILNANITRGFVDFVPDIREKTLTVYKQLIDSVENQFRKQLIITQGDELIFQQLLTKYKYFLYPYAQGITSQPVLKGKITRKPDFHIQKNQTEMIYVEIEPPFFKPFEGVIMSNRCTVALQQVFDWKTIISEKNTEEEKHVYNYLIIIGMKSDLSLIEMEALENFNKLQSDLLIVTWDYILDNITELRNRFNDATSKKAQ